MIFVKNMEAVAANLKRQLPNCDIKATKLGVTLKPKE